MFGVLVPLLAFYLCAMDHHTLSDLPAHISSRSDIQAGASWALCSGFLRTTRWQPSHQLRLEALLQAHMVVGGI